MNAKSAVLPIVSVICVLGVLFFLFREEPERTPVVPTEGGLGLSKEERELFIPTKEWQTVEENHLCPPGLEYRIDLSTGSKLARLPQ
jgi:hypothetical protein